jgi:AcrR family transcriptional regulator
MAPGGDTVRPDDAEPADGSAASTDGRQLRRERNREAVVEALLDLYHEGNLRPSTEEVAARSGLSPRSLFRYFDDVDDLTRTAMRRQQERVQHLFPIAVPRDTPSDAKVEALVDQRFRLYDAIGDAAIVARLRAPFQPVLAEQVRQNRALFRAQIERLFAPELAAMPDGRGARVLAAADVLTTYEACRHLTADQGLTPEAARTVMTEALETLFGSSR